MSIYLMVDALEIDLLTVIKDVYAIYKTGVSFEY